MRLANTTRLLCICFFLFGMTSKSVAQDATFKDSVAIITGKDRPEQVIQNINFSNIHFSKAKNNRVNFGLVGSGYYYFLLKVNAGVANENLYLSIDNTSLDTLSVYKIDDHNKGSLVYRGGSLIPFDQNNHYVWHTMPLAVNNVPSFYIIAMKASQKNINVRYEVLDREELHQKYQTHDRFIFFYNGIVCLIAIIILLALFLFRKIVFAAYLGYIVCAFTWIISHYGYLFPYIYPRVPILNEIIKPVSSLGAGYFLLMVMNHVFRRQLQSHQTLQRATGAMLAILPFLIACMFLLLIPGLHFAVKNILIATWHVALIITLFLVALSPVSLFKSGATARIFSTAMFVICAATAIQLLANSGFINNFFIEEHGTATGSLLENIIIAFGLFYNLLQERKQKEQQVLALELEQADTLKKLITVQDNERKRIAGDLHDNIGPLLAALKINFRRIIHTKENHTLNGLATKTELIIDESIAEIHNVALNLMPKSLASNGLINTLQEYFQSIQQLYNKPIIFKHRVDTILNPDLQISLYRIVCELVLNAARHSDASNITVGINANEKTASLFISDDGKGFKMKPGNNKNSLGLQNAESRVMYLKGAFDLQTEAGKGTQIKINIPVQAQVNRQQTNK